MKKLKQMYRCMDDRKYRNKKTTGCPTKTLGHDRRCGFTLVELVITIAIVIILSVISVPIYRGYVDKAKYAEGYALLGAVLSAQKAYYSEYGNYLKNAQSNGGKGNFTCNEEVLGIDARSNKYFSWFAVDCVHCVATKPAELIKDRYKYLLLQWSRKNGVRVIDFSGAWAEVNDWYTEEDIE